MSWLEWLIASAILLIIGAMVYVAIADSSSPTIELNRAEWACTKHETSIVIVPVLVGKVTIMQAQPITRCARWERT